jgi:predicted nucleic acid-binding Zn ribbon protein
MDDKKGPENLGDILGKLFAARGWGRKNDRLKLEGAWAEAAGPQLLKETRVMNVRRGVMEIEVKGSVLLQELAQFHKRTLLGKLRKLLPSLTLTDLKFKAGAW